MIHLDRLRCSKLLNVVNIAVYCCPTLLCLLSSPLFVGMPAVSIACGHCRQEQIQASLASRESSPDESLVAEGWIVAGTILMSNRTNGKHVLRLKCHVACSIEGLADVCSTALLFACAACSRQLRRSISLGPGLASSQSKWCPMCLSPHPTDALCTSPFDCAAVHEIEKISVCCLVT